MRLALPVGTFHRPPLGARTIAAHRGAAQAWLEFYAPNRLIGTFIGRHFRGRLRVKSAVDRMSAPEEHRRFAERSQDKADPHKF
jgi:hypothetical protein